MTSSNNAIVVVKGNDTNFNGQSLLTLHLNSDYLDLSTFTATFTLCGIIKTFDASSGVIVVDYNAQETASIPFGHQDGVLKLYDRSHKVATIESLIPFEFVSVVHGDAIATKPFEMTINVEQGGENILNIDVETYLIQIQVGSVTTLPAGLQAYVTNTGTANEAVFNFGIPRGDSITKIEKTSTSGLVDTYTITFESGKTTTYEVTNGSSIQSIEKTDTDVLVDTYTVTLTNGDTTTFEVTNGRGISSIAKTSTSGLVDTYTITYNDNTTSTFNITNGKDATINGVNALTLNTAYGLSISQSGDTATISGKDITDVVDGISALIPSQATEQNQLADKAFVNSSIATNTANFIGTFNSVAELEAYSGTLTNNDYAFVVGTDSAGNTKYDRYKYTTATTPASWEYEYTLNNSSFTAGQWAAINSGATTTNIGQITTNKNAIGTLANLTTTEKSSLVGAINELDNDKQENITGGASTITSSDLTANRALISNAQGKVAVSPVTNTELGYLSGATSSIQTQLNGKASTSLNNLSADGQMIIDSQNGTISNCILDIPQDLKFELNNGALTLKSGSKYYMADGNQYQISADRTTTQSSNGKFMVLTPTSGTSIATVSLSKCVSGSTDSLAGTSYHAWFDTTNNVVNYYSSDGTTPLVRSLPLAIVTASNGAISSIDQVFNGAGYIGHHAFVLPGIKGLAPNGFNSDGTYNNTSITTNTLAIREMSTGQTVTGISRAVSFNANWSGYKEVDKYTDADFTKGWVRYYVKEYNKIYTYNGSSVILENNIPLVLYNYDGTSVTRFDVRQTVSLATTEMVNNYLSSLTGYDASATQTLKNVNGVLTWVTDA